MATEDYGNLADDIAAELRRLGWWPEGVPDGAPPIEVSGAFGQPDLPFAHWIALVLVPRLREVAAGDSPPPSSSMVAAQAVREFDGINEAVELIDLLSRLDELVEGDAVSP